MVAFQDKPGVHNGGDSGGWGNGNPTGSGFDPENGSDITSSELLISQMAALDVSSVRIELIINGEIQEPIIADATTTKDRFPKIRPGAVVSGIAYIYVNGETEPREARLEETVTGVNKTLPFKVPYYFKAYDLSGTLVKEGEYFARDGIHLEAQTVAPIAGWQCVEDGSIHYGGYVAGVRGDITLNAVLGSGAGLSAVSDKSVLYATATGSDTATITITNATGTPQVSSISTELEPQGTFVPDSSNPLNYTLTVKIKDNPAAVAGGVPVWFSDNTAASITITDDSGITTSVPLTLKNKYTYFLKNHVGAGGTIARGPLDAGGTLAFADAVAVFASGYSVPIPSDRSVVAFKDEATGIIYKETDFPITFNSTNFSSRSITFKALLDFGMTITGGKGDGTTHAGTEADPYILNYNGTDNTDATKITVNVTGNEGSIIARSDRTGLTIGHPASGDTTQYITISKTSLAATAIPAAGLTFKITVRDYRNDGAGSADNDACLYSKQTFWVRIPQPEFTVSFNTSTGGSTAPSDQTITCGDYATAPTANPTNSDTSLVFGGWYTSTNGGTTLSSTAYNFGTTPVTADITLYAKWLHTNFTGTAAEFLAAEFVPNNTAASSYTVTITSATPDELSSIGKALGKSSDSHYKGVYVSLDLSGCGATSIPAWAFCALDNLSSQAGSDIATYLTGVTLPSGITSIGQAAFYGCAGLTGSFTIPSTVSVIERSIFNNCTGITGLTIENGVQKIGNYAFENCTSLTGTIVIPDSVTEIAPGSFHGCTNIVDFNVTGIWDEHWLEATGSITAANIALDKADFLSTGYYYIRQP